MKVTSTQPFSREIEGRELARRDEIEDKINKLPWGLQEAELRKEQDRRDEWERLRKQYNESGGSTNSVPPESLPATGSPAGGTGNNQQTSTDLLMTENPTSPQPVSTAPPATIPDLQQRLGLEPFVIEVGHAYESRRRRRLRGIWGRFRRLDADGNKS